LKFYQITNVNDNIQKYPLYTIWGYILHIIVNIDRILSSYRIAIHTIHTKETSVYPSSNQLIPSRIGGHTIRLRRNSKERKTRILAILRRPN
jgi:hypothetical protein